MERGRVDAATLEDLVKKGEVDTVVLALKEVIRRSRIEELKGLMGKVRLDIDLAKSRRRPRRHRP